MISRPTLNFSVRWTASVCLVVLGRFVRQLLDSSSFLLRLVSGEIWPSTALDATKKWKFKPADNAVLRCMQNYLFRFSFGLPIKRFHIIT